MHVIKYLNWKVNNDSFEKDKKVTRNDEVMKTTRTLIKVEYVMIALYVLSSLLILLTGDYSTGEGILVNILLFVFVLSWCALRVHAVIDLKKKLKQFEDKISKPVNSYEYNFNDIINTIWHSDVESIVIYPGSMSIMARGWDDVLTVEVSDIVVRDGELNAITLTEAGIFIGNQDSVGKFNLETKNVEIKLTISKD